MSQQTHAAPATGPETLSLFEVRRGTPAAAELAAAVVVLASVLRTREGADAGAAPSAPRAPWTRSATYRPPGSWRVPGSSRAG
ncbi:acyl-CoA carboxylase epsilon subunit [Nocardiopsis mangrovi]|uniref:Acyl-CoA carboxylase epsilon subunit n=1 Tax=Nocardiopsis mangrovi TaxID=1179818 RepID=A0ABV9E109_9ACTN